MLDDGFEVLVVVLRRWTTAVDGGVVELLVMATRVGVLLGGGSGGLLWVIGLGCYASDHVT